MDIIEELSKKKITFSNNISNKLDLANNIKDIITDDIIVELNENNNELSNKKHDIHAHESLHEFIDNHFSLTFLILLLSCIIFGSFYILYSIRALYKTSHHDIIKFCPSNYLWFYLLLCLTVIKYFYYLCLKAGLLLDNKRNCTYYVYAFLVINIIPIPFGNKYIFTTCINTNFNNKLILTMSIIDLYMQIFLSYISILYLIWRSYRKCPLYLKNNTLKIVQENNNDENKKNNKEGFGE